MSDINSYLSERLSSPCGEVTVMNVRDNLKCERQRAVEVLIDFCNTIKELEYYVLASKVVSEKSSTSNMTNSSVLLSSHKVEEFMKNPGEFTNIIAISRLHSTLLRFTNNDNCSGFDENIQRNLNVSPKKCGKIPVNNLKTTKISPSKTKKKEITHSNKQKTLTGFFKKS
ncbi:MAG: hypothetical protein MHMPM18_001104 [Marteilia pararefringens]